MIARPLVLWQFVVVAVVAVVWGCIVIVAVVIFYGNM